MPVKPDRWERAEARAKLAQDAVVLISQGKTLASAARLLRVKPDQLTKWVCLFREYGFGGFHRRPYRPRPTLRTEEAVAEALRREKIVLDAYKLMAAEFLSQKRAAYKLHVPMSQLSRWRRAYEESGFTGLLPKASKFGPKRD